MIVEAIIVGIATFATMALTNTLVRAIGFGGLVVGITQIATVGAVGMLLFVSGVTNIFAPFAMIGVVILTRVLGVVYLIWMSHRALSGKLGDEAQWAAELFESDDEKFVEAVQNMPEMRLQEFAIMAEDKDELRELVVGHYQDDIESQIEA